MISRTTSRFRKTFESLPTPVQERARSAYKQFRHDAYHPSLRFKRVHATQPIYSVRIGPNHRALAVRREDDAVWFWIGTHAEYDRLLKTR